MEKKDTFVLFESSVQLDGEINKRKEYATILFADLAGSTKFKVDNGQILGLKKTFVHNSVVTKLVTGKGEVIKYIGDEVMIIFKGDNSATIACESAIEIQKELHRVSKENIDDPIFPIESQIGIHSGDVYFWEYGGQTPEDPQGTVVDTAARIVSLAKPNQILSSETTTAIAKLNASIITPAEERNAKGISESIRVSEILWDSKERGINYLRVPPSKDPNVLVLVKQGRQLLREGNTDAAITSIKSALAISPLDFKTNIRLAYIYLSVKGDFENARVYLDKVRNVNPSSPRLWVLEGFLAWRQKDNDLAIKYTEKGIELAEEVEDREEFRLGMGNLAYYLANREAPGDLDRALEICNEMMLQYRFLDTVEFAGFLDTCALVNLKRGSKDEIIRTRELLEEAAKRDPENPFVHEKFAELIRKEQDLGIRTFPGPRY